MKKLVRVAFVFALTPFVTFAQVKKIVPAAQPAMKQGMQMSMGSPTAKGTWLLGGNASFESTDGSSTWELSPDLGYFIKDNLAIGGRAAIGDAGFGTYYAFTAFIKPYFGQSDMGKFFIEPNVGFAGADGADTELTYGGRAGYALFLNRSIALELGVGYQKTGDFPSIFGALVGFQIHFKK